MAPPAALTPPTALAPETEVLLHCAGASLDSEGAARVDRLARQGIDWHRLTELAQAHGVTAQVYRNLRAAGTEAVPPDALDRLRALVHALAWRNLLLTRELAGLVEALRSRGIAAVPFKGPVLAVQAYGDPSPRPFADFDILVREADAVGAKDFLLSQGYWPEPALSAAETLAFLRADREHHFTLRQKGSAVAVELHWRLLQRCFAFPLETTGLWDRLVAVRLGEAAVRTFAPEDLLTLLCAHGAKHVWSRLRLVADLDGLIRSHPGLDWDHVLRQAEVLHGGRLLAVGLALTQNFFGTPLPAAVTARVRRDDRAPGMAREVTALALGEPRDQAAVEADDDGAFFVRARERLRDRVRVCLGLERIPAGVGRESLPPFARWYFRFALAVKPKEQDREVVRLPGPLAALYYLVRPARLLGKYVRGLGRRWAGRR